jgi:hypothetical protein
MIGSVKKELRPVHDNVTCDVCERTILKGERTEAFLAPGGHRHQVCELCFARAEHGGWIRESAAGDAPSRVPRHEPRRPLLGRLLGRAARREEVAEGAEPELAVEEPLGDGNTLGGTGSAPPEGTEPAPPARPRRSRPRDPRHVRAVPTTGEVKVERALELFNGSEHQRTIAGLVRTLGPPWASARPDLEQPSAVDVVVAWELSWYRFRVDLGDEGHPVALLDKGEELEQLEGELRDWNTDVDGDGRLLTAALPEEDR